MSEAVAGSSLADETCSRSGRVDSKTMAGTAELNSEARESDGEGTVKESREAARVLVEGRVPLNLPLGDPLLKRWDGDFPLAVGLSESFGEGINAAASPGLVIAMT